MRNSIKLNGNTSYGVYLYLMGKNKIAAELIDENIEFVVPSGFLVLLNQSCVFELDITKKEVISLEYVTNL